MISSAAPIRARSLSLYPLIAHHLLLLGLTRRRLWGFPWPRVLNGVVELVVRSFLRKSRYQSTTGSFECAFCAFKHKILAFEAR